MRVAPALLVTLLMLAPAAAGAQGVGDLERAGMHNRLGWEQMRAEHWAEAAKAFQQAIEIVPTFKYAYYGLGRANLSLKKYIDAIAALEKCRDLYLADAGRKFASSQEAQRFRQDRLTEIDEQIRLEGTGRQRAGGQDTMRQLQLARRNVQESLQRGGSVTIEGTVPPWVSLSLGSAFFRATKLADAEREYKATIAADSKAGEAHNNLAVVFLETGRYAEAEASIKEAKKAGFRVQLALEHEIAERKKGSR